MDGIGYDDTAVGPRPFESCKYAVKGLDFSQIAAVQIVFDKIRGRIEAEYMAHLQNQVPFGGEGCQLEGFGSGFGDGFFDEYRLPVFKHFLTERKVAGGRRYHVHCSHQIKKLPVVFGNVIRCNPLLTALLPAGFRNFGHIEIHGKIGQDPQVVGPPASGSDLHDFHGMTRFFR